MNELENVKVGDKLIVRNNFEEKIETVVKVTKTLAITQYHKFRIKDGFPQPRNSWRFTYAKPATPEDIERNIRRENIQFCKDTNYDKLTDNQLERIIDIINDKN